jgi:hypothetical protein
MKTVKISLLGLGLTASAFALADWSDMQNWVLEKATTSLNSLDTLREQIRTSDTTKKVDRLRLSLRRNVLSIAQSIDVACGLTLLEEEDDAKDKKELKRIVSIPHKMTHFKFYEAKTREFLEYLKYPNADQIEIYPMAEDDPRHEHAAGYASSNGTIVLQLYENRGWSDAYCLFTCAHEAAHHACGHVGLTGMFDKRDSFAIEKEADVTAARMLCAHGYRWVVEKEVEYLFRQVESGHELNDGIHPSYKEKHVYLAAVLQEPIKEKKPFGFDRQMICFMLTGIALGTAYHWYSVYSH